MSEQAPSAPSFSEALRYWLKLGCISFGGPAGQIAIMQTELVEKRRWISQGRFLHALNYCMVLPGPEAQQLATYLGWLLHGVRGGIAAGVLFVLPSLLLLIGLSWAYLALGPPAAATLLAGVKPAVVAVVAFAAWRIGSKTLRHPALWALVLASLLALSLASNQVWLFPVLLLAAAAIGWLLRKRLEPAGQGSASVKPHAPALIDDDTPSPPHAAIHRGRLLRVALIGVAFGVLVLIALWLFGGSGTLPRMGAFFTQAALLTFGGAYAVMPYVFQNAVQTYGWITPAQMLDGLALGESTPGPLIMVVAFIGYVGAAGAGNALGAGIAGAMVATFFTFLPSFLFILLGAPFVERSRGLQALAAPLAAITAAVVGAILHLALTLGREVLLPHGALDVTALTLTAAGFVALWRDWLGVVPVIALSAVIGGLLAYLT
ncbi:MAG: chromate efflux transporter [Stagnimonas sp.]|nr:chromate efflux transporter [Stagnimonas sp.]